MLKILCAEYINLQENLSNKDKITLLKFVKESTDTQVSHLLITGKMVSEEILQEVFPKGVSAYPGWFKDMQNVVQSFSGDRAGDSWNALTRMVMKTGEASHKAGKIEGMITVGGAVAAALAITLAAKVYKNYFSKAARACKGKKGPEKQKCMRDVKINARKQKIMSLTKAQGICSKTKQPEKCVAGLKLKIAKEKIKMKKIKY